jgi:hypothetical protein
MQLSGTTSPRMVEVERVPQHRLAQILGQDSPDTAMVYVRDMQRHPQGAVEEKAWT